MKNKQLAIEAINKDCKIRCRYLNDNGETCAIGCLAQLAGATLPEVGSDVQGNFVGLVEPIWKPIESFFGLDRYQQRRIQALNDATDLVEQRRKTIIEYLNELPNE